MCLSLSSEVDLEVPTWPGSGSSGCYWSWLGKWLLFCCVFVPTCLPPPLRKWRNDVTQPHFPALFCAWVLKWSFLGYPFSSSSGINLWKAKNKAAGGGGVQGRRWHNDSLWSLQQMRREIIKLYYAKSFRVLLKVLITLSRMAVLATFHCALNMYG